MGESGHETKAAREPPPETVCAQYRKDIPASAAVSHEGADYVRYFCGNNCLSQWQRAHRAQKNNS